MAFKPGKSGNPLGRPPKIATAQALRDELMPDMPEIIGVLKQKAKEGDQGAIKLILDRCYPALKPQTLPVSITMGANLPETGNNILQATLNGNLSPDAGMQLLTALTESAKIKELAEISERLTQIEARLNK